MRQTRLLMSSRRQSQ